MAKDSLLNRKPRRWVARLIVALLIILPVAGLALFGGYYYNKYQALNKMSSEQFAERDNQRIITAVGKLYSLPKDETPSVATIKDKETVKKQYPFLNQAENGDTLLLYKNAQLAILYRSSSQQLIKVGALNIQENPRVKVLGTEADRQAVEKALTDNKLTFTTGSAKATPVGVQVVDIKGGLDQQVAQIAALVKGQVATMPAGEDKPNDADIVIFAGPVTNP